MPSLFPYLTTLSVSQHEAVFPLLTRASTVVFGLVPRLLRESEGETKHGISFLVDISLGTILSRAGGGKLKSALNNAPIHKLQR